MRLVSIVRDVSCPSIIKVCISVGSFPHFLNILTLSTRMFGGPLNASSGDNYKYYVIFVDDHTRMTWLYMLRESKEVFRCFQIFAYEIKNQYDTILKLFRSDNDLEHVFTVSNYFHDHGRIPEIPCVHTPVSERKHRHLLGVIRCLLFKMSVPKCYQPETLLTACSLVNRMPSLVLDNKTPYSLTSKQALT